MALMLLGSTMISYTVKAVVIITLFLLLVIVCCATIDAIFGRCLLLEKLLLSLLNFGEVDHCIVSAGPHIFFKEPANRSTGPAWATKARP